MDQKNAVAALPSVRETLLGGPTSPKLKLSRRAVDEALAQHQKGQRTRIWFSDAPGLYLQITTSGCASYVLRFLKLDGSKGDYTIGKERAITPDKAKTKAANLVADLRLNGTDPIKAKKAAVAESKARKLDTFSSLA